jgi:hypothetical protein
MRETAGVGVIVLLAVYVWWMNHQGREIEDEIAKAQKRAASVSMPRPAPTGQVAPGFTGNWENPARLRQQPARR